MGNTFSTGLVSSLFAVAFVAGCSSTHGATDVASGIYELRVTSERDACSPQRSTGPMGEVAVLSADDLLNIGLADGARVSLNQADGYHGSFDLPIASCAGATLHREWTVLRSTQGGFSLAYAEEWTGIGACPSVAMPAAPSHDCRADLVLDYVRTTACEAPCELRLSATGPSCSCS